MNKKVLSTAVLLGMTAVTATAAPQSEMMFNVFDTDKNGEISMTEYRNGGMDAEGGNWSEGLSTVCTEHVLKSAEPQLIESFTLLDSDKDKKISRTEFLKNGENIYNQYWNTSFKEADGDNNGKLSRGEFKQQTSTYVETLKKSYANKAIPTECKADMEYWSTYYQQMNQYIDMAFGYLDQNSDGTLSYPEYKGTHLWN